MIKCMFSGRNRGPNFTGTSASQRKILFSWWKIDEGETLLEAIQREIEEELQLHFSQDDFTYIEK